MNPDEVEVTLDRSQITMLCVAAAYFLASMPQYDAALSAGIAYPLSDDDLVEHAEGLRYIRRRLVGAQDALKIAMSR